MIYDDSNHNFAMIDCSSDVCMVGLHTGRDGVGCGSEWGYGWGNGDGGDHGNGDGHTAGVFGYNRTGAGDCGSGGGAGDSCGDGTGVGI